MAKNVMMVSKLPDASCSACHGIGAVRMTAHFHAGDSEFEAPCWECFGSNVQVTFPKAPTTDN